MSAPRLSVIIASYNARATIESCLHALARQDGADPFEVIVIDSSTDGTAALVSRCFPEVRLIACAQRAYPGSARNIGMSHARAEVIAFTDADCIVTRTWVRDILAAHAAMPHAAIGGAVENGNPGSYVGWAYFFAEFSAWLPQRTTCDMVEIPTTCLTLKRWAFDKYGPFLEGTYCSDSAFCWTLARHGHRPVFLPSLRVSHINVTELGPFLRRKAFHGWCFAKVRVSEERFSPARRLLYVAAAPLLPLVLFARIVRCLARKERYLTRFVAASPLVFLGLVAWSWGELRGYLLAPAGGVAP